MSCPEAIQSAKVLPSSFNVKPTVQGKSLSLTLTQPEPLTIEVNGNWVGALSIGAELREDVDDVRFTNCDIIHDKGREWTLRVYHCDSVRTRNNQPISWQPPARANVHAHA